MNEAGEEKFSAGYSDKPRCTEGEALLAKRNVRDLTIWVSTQFLFA
jgi:hypothetical protein